MKKLFLSLILCAICGAASAQTLSISNVEVKPGDKATFTLTVNVGDLMAVGFKLEGLALPDGITISGKTALNASEWIRRDGVSDELTNDLLFMHNKQEDGTYMITMASPGFMIPKNTDFEIATIEIAANTATPIANNTITIPDGSFNFVDGDNDFPVGEVKFNLDVVSAYTIVLDENSTTAPEEASGVNVKVLRTITGDNWSTICLPFAMTAEQLEKAFGEVPEVKDFTGYDYDKDNDVIKVNFSAVTAMEANHPYIIKIGSSITEFEVEGVDIDPDEYPSVSFGSGKGKQYWAMDFIGTYVANFDMFENIGWNSTSPLFLSENKWWFATDATPKLKAFRAFFDFSDFTPSASTRINMSFDEQTGIDNVTYQLDGEFYDLKGQRVETPSKGIFIKGGKKVVVK